MCYSRSTIGYLLCIINNNKIILVSITNLFENLLRLFETSNYSLKPEHARASNCHRRLQTAQISSQTSDNALQNHFNVILILHTLVSTQYNPIYIYINYTDLYVYYICIIYIYTLIHTLTHVPSVDVYR